MTNKINSKINNKINNNSKKRNTDNSLKNNKENINNSESKLEEIKIINKGTGAGGANTNKTGLSFEKKTDNSLKLLDRGFIQKAGHLEKNILEESEIKKIIFVSQSKFKKYVKNNYKIDSIRNPDEAYIYEYKNGKKIIKILEKKNQNRDGSVETKLWSSVALKREYEIVFGDDFEIEYIFCVSDFLKNKFTSNIKKYQILKKIFEENNIKLFYGDDDDYFEKINRFLDL
jgi:5-hydroxyisourate hydrolase-like protein (transthyretin family)